MGKSECYKEIVERVVAALGISKVDLGRKFEVSKSVVNSWRITGIPGKYCESLERMLENTSDPMTKKDMRPFDWKKIFPELTISSGNEDEKDIKSAA